MGVQCRCGRFMAKPKAIVGTGGEGYSWHVFISEVRGDCSRCGPDSLAGVGPWFEWDNWKWPDEPAFA